MGALLLVIYGAVHVHWLLPHVISSWYGGKDEAAIVLRFQNRPALSSPEFFWLTTFSFELQGIMLESFLIISHRQALTYSAV